MNKDKINKLKEIDTQVLFSIKKELLNMKISSYFGQVRDFSRFKKLRAKVARIQSGLEVKADDK